jgi:hypothetical protein
MRVRFSGAESHPDNPSLQFHHPVIMNSSLETLERPSSPLQYTSVLTQNGFNCTLITLEPHAETVLPAIPSPDEQLLFVLKGDLAIKTDGVTTLLSREAATLLPSDRPVVLTTPAGSSSRALRVQIPPRRIVTPQIITPGN